MALSGESSSTSSTTSSPGDSGGASSYTLTLFFDYAPSDFSVFFDLPVLTDKEPVDPFLSTSFLFISGDMLSSILIGDASGDYYLGAVWKGVIAVYAFVDLSPFDVKSLGERALSAAFQVLPAASRSISWF